MKRLLVSAALLAVCFSVCLYGYFKVEKDANLLTEELNLAFSLIQEDQAENVPAQLEKCTSLWSEIKPTFSIFLSHDLFRKLDLIMPSLNQSYESDRKICAENILQAETALEEILEEQKMSVGNLL